MAEVDDDLLNADDIEALLSAAASGQPETADDGSASPSGDTAASGPSPAGDGSATAAGPSAEGLLDQAEAHLAEAVQSNLDPGIPAELGQPQPFSFEPFESTGAEQAPADGWNSLQDVELDLRIELGRTELLIDEVLKLKAGSVVPLDKLAGDPVDILINDRLIARGEVLVLNDNFCVRVAEILAPEQ